MAQPPKLYGGRLIGAAALALMVWALPLVAYAVFAKANPDNIEAQRLAVRWVGKNQSLVIGILSLVAALAAFYDYRMRRKAQWTLRSAMAFGFIMGSVQWIPALTMGERQEFWIVKTAASSITIFVLIVFTRLIAQEVEQLEGNVGVA